MLQRVAAVAAAGLRASRGWVAAWAPVSHGDQAQPEPAGRTCGAPDADGTRNDQGVFGGAWGNWIDVDNDRDGFSEREGDCDDTDPEVLGDPRQECEDTRGCSAAPREAPGWWLVGLLVLSGRRRSG